MSRRRIRVGLIGLGRIVREGHLPAYAANADVIDVVAAADPHEETLRTVCGMLSLPPGDQYADPDALTLHADVDAVVVASPPHRHHETVISALDRGIAVVCEKPLCVDLGQLAAIEDALDRTRGFLSVLHNYVYKPGWRSLIELARADGIIGTPVMARFEELSGDHWREHPDTSRSWRQTPDTGGGPLKDNLYHTFYLAEELLGAPIQSASGMQATLVHPYPAGDAAAVTMRHENGALTQATAIWCHRGSSRACVEVLGTEGSLRYSYWQEPDLLYHDDGDETRPIPVTGWDEAADSGYVAALAEVMTAIGDGAGPPHGIDAAGRVLRAMETLPAPAARRRSTGPS